MLIIGVNRLFRTQQGEYNMSKGREERYNTPCVLCAACCVRCAACRVHTGTTMLCGAAFLYRYYSPSSSGTAVLQRK